MATLQELMAQKVLLEKQIEETRAAEIAEAVAQIRSIMSAYDLSQADIFAKARKSNAGSSTVAKLSKVAAKYRDPESGKEWSGRGITPKWLQGKDKTQYLIA